VKAQPTRERPRNTRSRSRRHRFSQPCADGLNAYWSSKLARNVARDKASDEALVELGWRVFIVWECEIASKATLGEAVTTLDAQMRGT
jgi:G:T-mismatch repair DNA endonuclease (very short patch repair protein)